MNPYVIIPIHSFVDVITNSSSEIYVYADNGTIDTVKQMLNNLLKAVGSTKTADDLFTFDITVGIDNPETRAQCEARGAKYMYEIDVSVNSPEGEAAIADHCGNYPKETSVRVVAKDATSEELKAAATVLSNLTGLFEMESCYNG